MQQWQQRQQMMQWQAQQMMAAQQQGFYQPMAYGYSPCNPQLMGGQGGAGAGAGKKSGGNNVVRGAAVAADIFGTVADLVQHFN